jgi:hypothetical protein
MRIIQEGGQIEFRDRPAPYWALGLFLLAGGVLGIVAPLGLATNAGALEPWERFVSVGLGVGVAAGGLWWLMQNPATEVRLDLTRRLLTLVCSSVRGRQVRQLSFGQLESAMVEQGKDSDGDPVWRPAVRLRDGGVVLLSQLWSHDEPGVRRAVATVAEACRLALHPEPIRRRE